MKFVSLVSSGIDSPVATYLISKKAEEIVVNIWNEVENYYKKEPDQLRREKAKYYGLIYVYRKSELLEQSMLKSANPRLN